MVESKFIPGRRGWVGSILKYTSHQVFENKPSKVPDCIADMTPTQLEVMRPICGIYFLCRNGQVVYVGQSTDIHARSRGHIPLKEFDAIFYIEVSEEKLDEVELYWINNLRPTYNGQAKLQVWEVTKNTLIELGINSIQKGDENAIRAIAKALGFKGSVSQSWRRIEAALRWNCGDFVVCKARAGGKRVGYEVNVFRLPESE